MSREKVKRIRTLARNELSFKVRMPRNNKGNVVGSMNFLPTKRNEEFAPEQVAELLDFFTKHSLYHGQIEYQKRNGKEIVLAAYWQGLSYIFEIA